MLNKLTLVEIWERNLALMQNDWTISTFDVINDLIGHINRSVHTWMYTEVFLFISRVNSLVFFGMRPKPEIFCACTFSQQGCHTNEDKVWGCMVGNWILGLWPLALVCLKCWMFNSVSTLLCVFSQPGISPEVRRKLGEAAVKAAKAVNYVGAGKTHKHSPTHISPQSLSTQYSDILLFVLLWRYGGVYNGRPT